MIQTIQKIIKIGSSGGVTIPAKELKRAKLTFGDEVRLTIEPVQKDHDKLLNEYQEFVQQYGATLKNLADK